MSTTLSVQAAPAHGNISKMWTAWQVISVLIITYYSVVFFTSLGNTPHARSIYLAIALILPVIACIAWTVGFLTFKTKRYVISCFCFLWGLVLSLPTIATGAVQMLISWGLV